METKTPTQKEICANCLRKRVLRKNKKGIGTAYCNKCYKELKE